MDWPTTSTSYIPSPKRPLEGCPDHSGTHKRAKLEDRDVPSYIGDSPLTPMSSGAHSPLKIRIRTSSSNGTSVLPSPSANSARGKRAIRPLKHETEEDAYAAAAKKPSRKPPKPKSVVAPGPAKIGPYPAIVGKHLELQDGRCLKECYKLAKRCQVCLNKQAGQECLFEGFRAFVVDEPPYNIVNADTPAFFSSSTEPDFPLQLPTTFNRQLTALDQQEMRASAAKALLPTLQLELEHASRPNAVRRPFNYGDRNTCDFCLTTAFMGNWFCGTCGRDYCFQCHERIGQYLPGNGQALHYTDPQTALAASHLAAHAVLQSTPVPLDDEPFYTETGRIQRKASVTKSASPPIVVDKATLSARDHAKLPPSVIVVKGKIQDPQLKRLLGCANSRLHDLDCLIPVASRRKEELAQLVKEMFDIAWVEGKLDLDRDPYKIPAGLEEVAAASPPENSLPYLIVDESKLSQDVFEKVWSQGQTLVVDGLDKKLEIDWSPRSFSTAFPKMKCTVEDCTTGLLKTTRIAEFFGSYGEGNRQGEVLKLKDWPTTSDFAAWQPDLFQDYTKALPMPDVTRRDGARNFAAHFPTNVNKPDLGPKMYCAYAGSDGPYGQGTTRMHMDAADAVNVMVYASDVDGQPGTALWYIYPASDAAKIRQFCFEVVAEERSKAGKLVTADDVRAQMDDPIHEQQLYLKAYLRDELFARYGVRGWRIEQKVGQAVFIPAGCPHQVVNQADCIKVASDFVSVENIDRCWQITSEFRQCTKKLAWREDLLQIKNLMYYTWLSCSSEVQSRVHGSPQTALVGTYTGNHAIQPELQASSPPIASRPLPRLRGRDPADIVPVLKPGPGTSIRTRPASSLEANEDMPVVQASAAVPLAPSLPQISFEAYVKAAVQAIV